MCDDVTVLLYFRVKNATIVRRRWYVASRIQEEKRAPTEIDFASRREKKERRRSIVCLRKARIIYTHDEKALIDWIS